MTEPQVWTLIGVFAATLVGVVTIVMTSFTQTLKASIGGVEKQIEAVEKRIGAVESRIDSLERQMDARFSAVDQKLAGLERDVSFLYRRHFGEPPAS